MNQHILIIKPDALGDFVLATPALFLLRKKYQYSRITLIVSEKSYPLARFCPDVNCVIAAPLFTYQGITDEQVVQAAGHLLYLLMTNSDILPQIGIVLRWDVDAYGAGALLFRMGIPSRLGYSEKCSNNKKLINKHYDQFYTQVVDDAIIEHEVIKNVRLVENNYNNIIKLQLSRYEMISSQLKVADLIAANQLNDGFIALGIGSSQAFKTFDYFHWKNLIDLLRKNFSFRVCLFGGPGDTNLANSLCQLTQCISFTDKIQVNELYSILKLSKLAICADSFVKHVAAAADVPTIELSCQSKNGCSKSEFGGERFGAWGNQSIILKPDHHLPGCHPDRCIVAEPHCILQIELNDIILAARSIFETKH